MPFLGNEFPRTFLRWNLLQRKDLLSNEELKIKPKALNLTLMTFCKLSAVKYSLESDSN